MRISSLTIVPFYFLLQPSYMDEEVYNKEYAIKMEFMVLQQSKKIHDLEIEFRLLNGYSSM